MSLIHNRSAVPLYEYRMMMMDDVTLFCVVFQQQKLRNRAVYTVRKEDVRRCARLPLLNHQHIQEHIFT